MTQGQCAFANARPNSRESMNSQATRITIASTTACQTSLVETIVWFRMLLAVSIKRDWAGRPRIVTAFVCGMLIAAPSGPLTSSLHSISLVPFRYSCPMVHLSPTMTGY